MTRRWEEWHEVQADVGVSDGGSVRSIPTAAPAESPAGGTATALGDPPAATECRPRTAVTAAPVEQLAPVPGARFAEIPVTAIVPNPKQPRQVFDEEALEELKISIQEVGFLQPIVVRELGADKYELVMGERRWRAAQALGQDVIPAIVRETRDDAMLRDALLENIHRANLNPLEEAAAYQQLLEEFGATHEELARRIGRSRPQISNTIRLLNLPAPVQRRVAAGVLSAGHARALLGARRLRGSRRRSRTGSSPRGCRSGRPRRWSRSRSPRARHEEGRRRQRRAEAARARL